MHINGTSAWILNNVTPSPSNSFTYYSSYITVPFQESLQNLLSGAWNFTGQTRFPWNTAEENGFLLYKDCVNFTQNSAEIYEVE